MKRSQTSDLITQDSEKLNCFVVCILVFLVETIQQSFIVINMLIIYKE